MVKLVIFAILVAAAVCAAVKGVMYLISRWPAKRTTGDRLRKRVDSHRKKVGARYGFSSEREFRRAKKIYARIEKECLTKAYYGERSYMYKKRITEAEFNYIRCTATKAGMRVMYEPVGIRICWDSPILGK